MRRNDTQSNGSLLESNLQEIFVTASGFTYHADIGNAGEYLDQFFDTFGIIGKGKILIHEIDLKSFRRDINTDINMFTRNRFFHNLQQ